MTTSGSDYPVRFDADYPESPSRLLALLGVLFFIKGLLLIPHIIVLIVLGLASVIVAYIGYWAVLITGRYPEGMFNFVYSVSRWSSRTDSWMYGWTDKYPPFTLGEGDYPARLDIDRPDASSRVLSLLGVLSIPFLIVYSLKMVLLIPHIIILMVLGTVTLVVSYIGYWAVLITGSYPQGLHNLILGVQRWEYRTTAWLFGLTDRYPPFSLS